MEHWARAALRKLSSLQTMGAVEWASLRRLADVVESQPAYVFREPRLEEISGKLSEDTDIDELSEHMQEVLSECGFDFFSIFLTAAGNGVVFRRRVITNYPESWIDNYYRKNYQFLDPVMGMAHKERQPFLFEQAISDAPVVDYFWEDARRYGIGDSGICISCECSHGVWVAVTYSSSRPRTEFKNLMAHLGSDLIEISHLAAMVFCTNLVILPAVSEPLSTKELRYLRDTILLNKNDSPNAPRTQSDHEKGVQLSIFRKLQVNSDFQAAAIAAANGWFNELPFDLHDLKM